MFVLSVVFILSAVLLPIAFLGRDLIVTFM
jgi:hypothetical protein